MAFHHWQVEEDAGFTPESDPIINKMMKREAGAAVIQDISLNTYWANTVGKTKYPGNYQLYLSELSENMCGLMKTRMAYREIEDFMVTLGYELGDIRKIFRELTGLDPVKLEFMRQEDVNKTPGNIPWYNLAWGMSRKKDVQSYFVMPGAGDFYTVFAQVGDMDRKEVGSFLLPEEAVEYLKPLVHRVHRYDMPACEQVCEAMEPMKQEPEKQQYRVLANHLWDLRSKGSLDTATAEKMVADAVFSGSLTEDEGKMMLDLYVYAAPPDAPAQHAVPTDTAPATYKESPSLDYKQDGADVEREVERVTPQDFFESVLPDRLDSIVPQHLKDVLSFVSHKQKDMSEFEVKLHSLEYMKHESPKALVETNPESGRPSGPPRATVSVILEIEDKTLSKGTGRKFALAVFFVNPDGEIGTSDSLKGEDDIIYGFSEDGLRQYFSRERMVRGV